MSRNYTMVGVAKALILDSNNNIVAEGVIDTLDNSTIEFSTSSTEVRGGNRNKLIGIYYHTPTGAMTISNVTYNLGLIAANLGTGDGAFGTEIFQTETVTLSGTTGTVANTPQKINSTDTYAVGYVTYSGVTTKVNFSGSTFSAPVGTPSGAEVQILYRYTNTDAEYIQIPASIIPDRVRIVLTCDLSTNETSTGVVGYVQFDVPVVQLSGSQTFNMTPDGYSKTEIKGMILADDENTAVGFASSGDGGKYVKISTILNDVNWYDNVVGLAIKDGDFSMSLAESTTSTLQVYAVTSTGRSFLASNSELTFSSGTTATATIGAHTGVITALTTGTTLISVAITDKLSIEAYATLTVTA